MSTTLYGIANCDTIKKAKKWLTEHDIPFTFHDYRKDGITAEFLDDAEKALGWEVMLNKRGTTYRQLTEEEKADITRDKALALLLTYPAMVKRPILNKDGEYHIGFKPAQYEEIF
ncbi:ArsC family reductase [Alteromonas sp. 345S023]|uniref:ArsC family reductase n=1 Tax=Alteromonas profundi TaxID=2696062 RepID=A0A7X5LQS7_9ALTE|nr:ArsC family reductase [Alteromonas profundi]NDV93010.1 ArsC family reductase [Alteromonas profundi]